MTDILHVFHGARQCSKQQIPAQTLLSTKITGLGLSSVCTLFRCLMTLVPIIVVLVILYLGTSSLQVCNHQFHSECLQKWGDTSCPVCR